MAGTVHERDVASILAGEREELSSLAKAYMKHLGEVSAVKRKFCMVLPKRINGQLDSVSHIGCE